MDQKKVGAFIALLRHEHGMTQEALGAKLGVTGKTVSRWENGNYMPDIGLLLPLAELFGVTVNELLSGRRLGEAEYREKAEENLLSTLRDSAFSVREKERYFTKKWNREHRFEVVFWLVLLLAADILGWICDASWVAPLLPLVAVVVFMRLRNARAGYVEGKIWGHKPEEETEKEKK